MKYWSSASSLATSTASPCPRRPARPHCWRSEATVPGKPTEITQSSRPTSIPSSSAFVALTPSSSPSSSRRSISRRCCGRVAGAVGREPRVVAEPVGGEAVDQLGGAAALGEAERAQAALDEVGHQLRRLAERARAQPQLLVGQRRVPERDRPLGARRGVVADHRRLDAEQPRAELAGVGDRRRGEQELRVGAVDAREPPQPPQHVGDVRAEDAAVDVRLVDDHVGEVREHVAPAVVVREHADVEHVRVGEDQVRPLAHLPAPLGRRCRRRRSRRAASGSRNEPSARSWSWASAFVG